MNNDQVTQVSQEINTSRSISESSTSASSTSISPAYGVTRKSNNSINVSDSSLRKNRRKSNYEYSQFYDLIGIISKMSDLPVQHVLHIDRELGVKAQSMLSIILENTSAPVPKIKNEDGEAVVFTWNASHGKKYLTVDDEQVDMLEVGPNDVARCTDLTENGILNLKSLLSELNFKIRSET